MEVHYGIFPYPESNWKSSCSIGENSFMAILANSGFSTCSIVWDDTFVN